MPVTPWEVALSDKELAEVRSFESKIDLALKRNYKRGPRRNPTYVRFSKKVSNSVIIGIMECYQEVGWKVGRTSVGLCFY